MHCLCWSANASRIKTRKNKVELSYSTEHLSKRRRDSLQNKVHFQVLKLYIARRIKAHNEVISRTQAPHTHIQPAQYRFWFIESHEKQSWYGISKITEYRGRGNLKICFIQLPNFDWDAPTNAQKFNSPQKIMVLYFLESQVIQLVCQTAYVVRKSHKRSNTTMKKPLTNCLLTLKILFSIMSTVPGRTDANITSYIKNLIFISFLGHERHIPN